MLWEFCVWNRVSRAGVRPIENSIFFVCAHPIELLMKIWFFIFLNCSLAFGFVNHVAYRSSEYTKISLS